MSDTKHNKLMKYSRIGNIIYLNIFKGNKMKNQVPVSSHAQNGFSSNETLFDMYLQEIESQGLDTDAVIRNKDKIIPLLEMIKKLDDDTSEYLEANKGLSILTLSDNKLFNIYLQAIELQGLDTDIINKNKSKITKLLRVIEEADEGSHEYKEANKRLSILTLKKPSFFKQVFNLA